MNKTSLIQPLLIIHYHIHWYSNYHLTWFARVSNSTIARPKYEQASKRIWVHYVLTSWLYSINILRIPLHNQASKGDVGNATGFFPRIRVVSLCVLSCQNGILTLSALLRPSKMGAHLIHLF